MSFFHKKKGSGKANAANVHMTEVSKAPHNAISSLFVSYL